MEPSLTELKASVHTCLLYNSGGIFQIPIFAWRVIQGFKQFLNDVRVTLTALLCSSVQSLGRDNVLYWLGKAYGSCFLKRCRAEATCGGMRMEPASELSRAL